MEILENNFKPLSQSEPSKHTCRWCKSVYTFEQSDITNGSIVYSQRERDDNIKGLICPCCNQFDNLNNGF